MADLDKIVEELFNKVDIEKKKISESEQKLTPKTNMNFSYPNDTQKHNLHIIKDVNVLVNILGTLISLKAVHDKAVEVLGLNTPFEYLGYSYENWEHDIKAKANILSVDKNKAKLKLLEDQLKGLLSPEQLRAKEIERLAKSLGEDFGN